MCELCPMVKGGSALDKELETLRQLRYLRDYWRDGWKPRAGVKRWSVDFDLKREALVVEPWRNLNRFLSFPTKEKARDFAHAFYDMIYTVRDWI